MQRAWFLENCVCMCVVCVCMFVCVYVCVCVCPPRVLITSGVMWHDMNPYDWLNKLYSCYMATAVIIVNRHSLDIDMRHGN